VLSLLSEAHVLVGQCREQSLENPSAYAPSRRSHYIQKEIRWGKQSFSNCGQNQRLEFQPKPPMKATLLVFQPIQAETVCRISPQGGFEKRTAKVSAVFGLSFSNGKHFTLTHLYIAFALCKIKTECHVLRRVTRSQQPAITAQEHHQ